MEEQTIELHGSPVFLRRAPSPGEAGARGVLYLHSVPTSGEDFAALLTRTGGVAPDLPGFGRSGKGGHLEYSLDAYTRFVVDLLDILGAGPTALAGHGWGGAIALAVARRDTRVERLALINPVAPVPALTWPRLVRWWQRPGVGELLMGSVTRRGLGRALRRGMADPARCSPDRIAAVWAAFDQGTQRAILRLHRAPDAIGLPEGAAGLSDVVQPTLIVWGDRDPWLPSDLPDALAARLPAATLERVPEAGHWPWLDRPELNTRLAEWLLTPG